MSRASSETGGRNIIHRRVELSPVGADGAAVVTYSLDTGPAVIRCLAVDYQNQPATTDLVIRSNDASGDVLFTASNTATDIIPRPVTMTGGIDEAGAAIAATDGTAGGMPVKSGIYFDVAQADGQTSGDEVIIVDVWYEEVELVTLIARPVGADGSAAFTGTAYTKNRGAGIIRAIKVDYQNQPVTTDVLVKSDTTSGVTLLTLSDSATDIALSPVGSPALNESNAATAATDATDGGWPFKSGIFVDVAQADGQTSGDELITFEFYCDT